MVDKTANMFITGPEVIKAVTGEVVTMAEIGGAAAHMQRAGNIHFIARDDKDALAIVRELLGYLPSNNTMDPPHRLKEPIVAPDDPQIGEIMPDNPQQPYDVRQILGRVLDEGRFLEVQEHFAPNIVTGLGRLSGIVVGIVANQPMHLAGCLDINASCKAARFIRTCNVFNIPIVTFVDVPGFLPGVNQEHGGIIRHGAKMLFAYSATTTPKLTVILRKAYGGAYLAMCSKDLHADRVLAWPTAEIAVMGGEGAVNIIYRKEIEAAQDKTAERVKLVERYRNEVANPSVAAARGFIDDVIDPAATRRQLCLSLRAVLTKRDLRPPKKHGNIPL
jgi:propionyl-CoA carboxylase beta chain